MKNYLINLTFLGTQFCGTQKNLDYRTIQGEFERLLSKFFNAETKITCCSRLDKGVHARNFYFNFKTEKEFDTGKLIYFLNDFTDEDVYVKSLIEVNLNFSSRYHAIEKVYCYRIKFGDKDPFNYQRMFITNFKLVDRKNRSYKKIIGEHNFINFSSDDDATSFVSKINDIKVEFDKDNVCSIRVFGKSFFRYQVRYIAGIIFEIMIGRKSELDLLQMLDGSQKYTKPRYLMPAKGLTLEEVKYDKKDLKIK